ncbi:MAG: MarR family transcriptional regulator [Actinomycetales bacterium]|nr:MarR family transcriptional regulator [Tetrasphaera sp.]NLX00157.1 MarR family transcriptional regulator [Actinomycetales bacterium]
MAAVTSLMRAQQLVLARVESVLRPLGITFARYEVLMLLVFSQRGTLPMSVIGSRLQVHPTSVTNAVDRLQGAGLVERLPHPTDRRATLVAITDEGRTVADKATAALNSEVFGRLGLAEKDLDALVGILSRLREDAGDFATRKPR